MLSSEQPCWLLLQGFVQLPPAADVPSKPSTNASTSAPVPKSTVKVEPSVAVSTSIPAFKTLYLAPYSNYRNDRYAASAEPLSDNAVAKFNSLNHIWITPRCAVTPPRAA